jgi:hypothetical protein
MQVDLDAVIAAIERLKCAHGNPDAETECYDAALHNAQIAIRALPASNARVEAGDAMKAACLADIKTWFPGDSLKDPKHAAGLSLIRSIESLDTAAIVGGEA